MKYKKIFVIVLALGLISAGFIVLSDNPTTDIKGQQKNSNKTNTSESAFDQNYKVNNPTNPSTTADKVEISSLEQTPTGDLVIKTKLIGFGSGSCQIAIQKGSKSVARTAEIIYQESFSTCAGFIIPYSEIGQEGEWQIKLQVNSGDKKASAEKTFSIKSP